METKNFFDLKQTKTTAGGVIRAFRKNFKLTQQELSQITGIAETNISAIENDKIEIGIKRAALLAAAFGIDPSLILFPNGFEAAFNKDIKKVREASAKFFSKKRAV